MRWFVAALLVAAAARAQIIAYASDEAVEGFLGSRAESSAFCLEMGARRFGCAAASAYLFYFNSSALDPAFASTGQVISATNADLGMVESFSFAEFPSFWLGDPRGVYSSCGEWRAASCANGLVRLPGGATKLKACSSKHHALCLCSGGATFATRPPTTGSPSLEPTTQRPTFAPTEYPTLAPTHSPSQSPTHTPSYVHNALCPPSRVCGRRARLVFGFWPTASRARRDASHVRLSTRPRRRLTPLQKLAHHHELLSIVSTSDFAVWKRAFLVIQLAHRHVRGRSRDCRREPIRASVQGL